MKLAKEIETVIYSRYSGISEEIEGLSKTMAENGYNGTWYAIEGAENLTLNMPIINERYIDAIVNEKVDGQTFSRRLYKNRDNLAKNTTSELLHGVSHGKGYPEIAKRISELTEADYKRALRIARTEGGRTQSHATQKSYENAEDLGVKLEKQWMATLDKKTRIAHQGLDGQRVGVKEQFNYEGNTANGPRLFNNAGLDINCRCTTIAVVNGVAPELRRDNEDGEAGPFQSYDEWAEAKGLKAKPERPKATIAKPEAPKTDWNNILVKTNMKEAVGEENYKGFIENLSGQEDPRINKLFEKFGSEVSFAKLKNGGASAYRAEVHLAQEDFSGGGLSKPFQMVYHEIGHAIDSRAAEVLRAKNPASMTTIQNMKSMVSGKKLDIEIRIKKASSSTEYNLGDTIKRDLWEYVNGKDVKMYSDLGPKPRKKAEKLLWNEEVNKIYEASSTNFPKFIEDFKAKHKDSMDAIYDLSDIVEGTQLSMYTNSYPFGAGHGSQYWKNDGALETEFMAHMFEAFTTSPDSREVLEEVMPNAVKKWQQLMDDVLKGD